MARQKTKSTCVRQYARPGCCYELPMEVNDDEQTAPKRTNTKSISTHTASWMEAMAGGRWQAPAEETNKSILNNTMKGLQSQMAGRQQGSDNRRSIQAEPAQSCRKRAQPDIVDDYDMTDGDKKRLRLSHIGMVGDEDGVQGHKFHINSRLCHLNSHSHSTNFYQQHPPNDAGELELSLRTMQRKVDLDRATIRDIQRAQEEARFREQEYRFTSQSTVRQMWQDCDRERRAAEERRKTREWEKRQEVRRKEEETEKQRLDELSNIETNLKSMWEAHDLARGLIPQNRPGQLSERGQRRARERAERLQRQNQ